MSSPVSSPAGGSGWQPANATEQAMAAALRSSDRSGYFRALAAAELLVPTPQAPDAPGVGDRPPVWTVRREGRTLVPVFTSPEALVAVLGQRARGVVRVGFHDLVAGWPDPEWWLAVDPGLPIDGYFPPDTVREGATGQLEVPTFDEFVDELTGGRGPGVPPGLIPLNDLERLLLSDVLKQDADSLLVEVLGADVLVPVDRPPALLPALASPEFPWPVVTVDGVRCVGVFTAPERLAGVVGRPEALPVMLANVLLCWPDPSYWLALNPGSVLGATVGGDDLRRLMEFVDSVGDQAFRVEPRRLPPAPRGPSGPPA